MTDRGNAVLLLDGISDNAEKAISSFCHITGIPVSYLDKQGEVRWECMRERKICQFFDIYNQPNSICTNNLLSSANIAAKLGEPYIFLCRAGFIKIAVSLIIKGKVVGCFMAGPIIMTEMSERIAANIFRLSPLPDEKISKVMVFIRTMKVYTPREIEYLSHIFKSCVLSCISQNTDYTRISNQQKEQARIGEDIQECKKRNEYAWTMYPYSVEKELIERVKSGDGTGAQERMQTLLNQILLIEAGNLNLVKTRILELCALLSRATAEGGIFPAIASDYVTSLNEVESVEELRQWTSRLIERFSQNVFDHIYVGSSQLIKEVVRYIHANYMNDISLGQIASDLSVNLAYLSTLFKREMGVSFREYLSRVRIKRSMELLATTTLSVLEIALSTGFEDQSYFTKVFKNVTGLTPKEYRRTARGSADQGRADLLA